MNQGLWYCGNIAVATLLCLNITFLSAIGAPIAISGLDLEKESLRTFSFKDKSFERNFEIHNRTVTCSGIAQGSHYPSPMFTCQEISVDGEKLYHGYSSDGRRNKQQQCPFGCPCGNNVGQANDIRALCNAMLNANKINETLIAAYVVKPHCNHEDGVSKRVKFYLTDNGLEIWEDVYTPNGYISTLQCLTEKPET